MDKELIRLASFSTFLSTFPEHANVSPLVLARNGFYYFETEGRPTIRCEGCGAEFNPLEHSSSILLEKHRRQSVDCRFTLATSAPSTLPRLPYPVGGTYHPTRSDDGSSIGPDDGMNNFRHIFSSASARAAHRGVFQTTAAAENLEPPKSFSLPLAQTERQIPDSVVYMREQLGSEGSQHEESRLHAIDNLPTSGPGSDFAPGSLAQPQGSTQGHAPRRDFEQLQHEVSRLQTFVNWPVDARVSSQDLAREGFLYTGQGDRVQCVFCRGYLKNWKAGDVIKTKHQKYSPNCPFLRGLVVTSVDSPDSRIQVMTFADPVSAVMDREEVSVLIPIVQNLGFNENDLRSLVAERLSRGDNCLSPTELLTALLT